MDMKNLSIEILPRASWMTMFSILVFSWQITGTFMDFNDNLFLLILGGFLTVIGMTLWPYIAYYMRKAFFDKTLLTEGPFKYARHPMYTAIYIFLTGLGLIFFSWLWFVIMVAFLPIWYSISKIEEKQMSEIYKEKYERYKKNTGMFIPRIQI
ncbi:MAG: isoprenylcysteine carboxylmethyltransferase family protein [Candidatus Saliniplasma sp.]